MWSREEPGRAGEIILLPPGNPGPWTVGRGEADSEDRRLAPVRQVPGGLLPGGPLASSRISRRQLRLSRVSGGLLVENVGSCPLLHRGREFARVEVTPGETLSLKNEMLFLCVQRGLVAAEAPGVPVHGFGGADAFGIVGESPAVWELRRRVVAVARTAFHVLILGESGTGKELVAQAIHASSARGHRPLVSRNAATIPAELAAAELFGNLKSYPNPGMPERPGLVGEAHGSTLFLDELAELPQALQAHLLRVIDDGEFQRLGEATTRKTDLRVLAATNRAASDVKDDVLARFSVRIVVPGLNDRREDVPLLAVHLLRRHAAEDPTLAERFFSGDVPRVSPVLMEALVQHHYTTHVRELEAILVRAALDGRGRYLELGAEARRDLHAPPTRKATAPIDGLTLEESARLALLRRHGFSPAACGRDPDYPGNRQTADLHLRQLLCRSLALADWDPRRAVEILAGSERPELIEKCAGRLSTFLGNLRARMAEGAPEALDLALAEEWKSGAGGVLRVVSALREGRLPASGPPPSAGRAKR